jgi:hypothetical protein
MTPNRNIVLPVNETPVIPPLPGLANSNTPISAPQTSPGTESGRLLKPKPEQPEAPAPLPPPVIVPAPAAPAPSPAAAPPAGSASAPG